MASKAIGTLGTIDTITVGGRVFTNLTSLIILYGWADGTGTSNRCTLRTANGSAGYQVTTGKTLTIRAVRFQTTGASNTAGVSPGNLAYADNDVGVATSTAFTNSVNMIGNTSFIQWGRASLYYGSDGDGAAIDFQVPALKYPAYVASNQICAIICYGYET